MKRSHIIIGLVFIILAGLLYISLRLDFDEAIQKALPGNNNEQTRQEEQEIIISRPPSDQEDKETEDDEQGDTQVGQAGSSSSDSSLGQGIEDEGQQDFCTQTIAYTLLDFDEEESCEEYREETCIRKSVNCSVNVQNLDYGLGGDFTVKTEFKNSGLIFKILSETQSIQPREVKQFSRTTLFTEENASLNFDCGYTTESAPATYIC